jgi:hypothetical protein
MSESETPKEGAPAGAELTDAQLAAELDAGWFIAFDRDPADPRFVVLTCRHPYPLGEETPTPATGPEAQFHTIAFAITTCAQQGIIPGQIAMRLLRDLGQQIQAVRANGGKFPEESRIIMPGQQ